MIEQKTYIYTLTDPRNNQVRYVGKSNNPTKRLYCHIGRTEKNHKYCWLKSLANEGHQPLLDIIDEVPIDEWVFWERYWIAQFRAWGFNLTNLTDGGEGFASGNLNPAHLSHVKELKSKTHKGKTISQAMRDSISEKLTGRKNPEHSKRMTGRTITKEQRNTASVSMRGKNSSLKEEQVKGIKTLLKNNFENLTYRQIGEKFNVSKDIIKKIKYEKAWVHISI